MVKKATALSSMAILLLPLLTQAAMLTFRLTDVLGEHTSGTLYVAGTVNDWNGTANPMGYVSGGSGEYTSGAIYQSDPVSVTAGDTIQYKFIIKSNQWDFVNPKNRVSILTMDSLQAIEGTTVIAESATVHFSVNAKSLYQNYPSTIYLVGEPPLSWGSDNPMSDDDGDSIWTLAYVFPAGSRPSIAYKFRGDDDNWENLTGGKLVDQNERLWMIDGSMSLVLPTWFFNDLGYEPSLQDVTVTFSVDCHVFAETIDRGVWLVGSQAPLVWGIETPDTTNRMTDMGNYLYTRDVLFPAGTFRFVEYKFVIDADSGWGEAELPGYNRNFTIDDTDSTQVLDTVFYDNQSGVDEMALDPRLPAGFALHQNYPNPFNPITEIQYRLSRPQIVNLAVYNLLGQRICVLVNGRRGAGLHRIIWDGRDDMAREVSSGVYFCRLEVEGFVNVKKMVMMR